MQSNTKPKNNHGPTIGIMAAIGGAILGFAGASYLASNHEESK